MGGVLKRYSRVTLDAHILEGSGRETPYVLPPVCEECQADVVEILENCHAPLELPPECTGALIFAFISCRDCMCEVVTDEMSPELAKLLCPLCVNLEICSAYQIEGEAGEIIKPIY